MQYIRRTWNATSKSNVEPKSNFLLFQSQIRQSRISFETIEFSWFRRRISKQLPAQIKLGTCEIRRLNWVMITVSSIDLVTVLDATLKQTCEKLECLYENLMLNDFR